MSEWRDISRSIDSTLVTWPGRARPQLRWEKSLAAGEHCNVSRWELSAHSGTHMDAPLHFVDGGKSIDQIPPEVFSGDCRVHELGTNPLDEIAARRLAGTRRLLLRSGHSVLHPDGRYDAHDALLTEPAATALLAGGLVLIGTDRLSVDDSGARSYRLHQVLLGAGCVILEGLALADVAEGVYTLIAAPLRFRAAEASPVRALLKR